MLDRDIIYNKTNQVNRSEQDYANILEKDGYVMIHKYLSAETCDKLADLIKNNINSNKPLSGDSELSIKEIVAKSKPVLIKRDGVHDKGFLDLFNIEYIDDILLSIRNDPFQKKIINKSSRKQFIPYRMNGYINKSLINTRDYHRDTIRQTFKAFVYLTDVPDNSFGPYSYVRGSHKINIVENQIRKTVNKIRNVSSTNVVFYRKSKVINFLGEKGTLIISDQRGYHRGLPQEDGKERILIVTTFTSNDY